MRNQKKKYISKLFSSTYQKNLLMKLLNKICLNKCPIQPCIQIRVSIFYKECCEILVFVHIRILYLRHFLVKTRNNYNINFS